MKPPTFFISSTIYDFKDLRSAIKYYLEQQGCRVLASDFNDFPKPLDTHSYEACLMSIAAADYFVLLIGARVGGWFDEPNQVSITQQEYREAYRLHKEGKLKILSFVRTDVWTMREERKGLKKEMKNADLPDKTKKDLANHPSKFAENPEFTIKFIEEVSRNQETTAAARGHGPLPTGNWVHVFDRFQDIIDAIQIQVLSGKPVEEAALRRLLRRELLQFLRISLIRGKNRAFSARQGVERFYASLSEKPSWDVLETRVNTDRIDELCSLWVASCLNTRYYATILPRALASAVFMDFDPLTGVMSEQPVYQGLVRLAIELDHYETARNNADSFGFFVETSPKRRGHVGDEMQVSTVKLLGMLVMMDRLCNIIELCKAIILHLDDRPFVMPNLRPKSPMYEDNDLDKQDATVEDTEAFLLS